MINIKCISFRGIVSASYPTLEPINMKPLKYIFLVLLFSSCAKVNYNPSGQNIAQTHQTIAILIPKVLLDYDGDNEKIDDIKSVEASNLQAELFDYLQRMKFENKLNVEILDIIDSNQKLASINALTLSVMNSNELCKLLGVDAMLTSNFTMKKPVSEELAPAFDLLSNAQLSTNTVKVTMAIHDAVSSEVIWHFNNQVNGGFGSSHKELIEKVLNKAVKKMPYYNKKF